MNMQRAAVPHPHPLIKVDPNIVYHEYNGRWTCDGCQRSPGNSMMPNHCSKCNFDLCDDCVQCINHPRHHHPLYYTNMQNVYPQYDGNWKCDGCGKNTLQLHESHGYHCPLDQFDLCAGCFKGKNYPIHIHELRPADSVLLYGHSIGMWQCDSCGRDGSQIGSQYPWNCSKCEFDACNDCMKPFNVEFHHHPLQITDSRVSYPQYGGRWKCDHCHCIVDQFIPGKDKSFHCAICKYDVCFSCMQRRTGWPSLDIAGEIPTLEPQRSQSQPQAPAFPGLMPGDEEEEPDEDLRCVVCMSRRKRATIVHGNTGHICCCMQCALTLWNKGDKCPICRAPIDNVIRHFTS